METRHIRDFYFNPKRFIWGQHKTNFAVYKTYEDIEKHGGEELRKAIQKIRERDIFIDPGYDGVFGSVKIFKDEKAQKSAEKQTKQQSLF